MLCLQEDVPLQLPGGDSWGPAGEARLHTENLPGTFQKCSRVGGTDVIFSLMQPVTYLIYSVISFSTAFCLVVECFMSLIEVLL